MTRPARIASLVAAVALAISACTPASGPILANPTAPRPSIAPATPPPVAIVDPQPVELPRDDGPHDRLTEWWYYTGHLASQDGRRFGFEYVIFRAERGAFPTTWASHLAVTDETGDAFHYAQRLEVGPQVDRSPRGVTGEPVGFDLSLSGIDPTDPTTFGRPPWAMAGTDGTDRLAASLAPDEAALAGVPGGLGLELDLRATKPPVLHDRDGWIDFGPAGGSYYYSRTAMDATGTLDLDGETLAVTGDAWFDHQWGDFISVGGGGWDWFAVNLDNGVDLTISLVRDADGSYPLIYGTLVDPDGTATHLDRDAFSVEVTDRWVSPLTGADYPAGWRIQIPSEALTIGLTPTVAAQELDTRATTGVVYWEGSQIVEASYGRGPTLGGQAYVELTGYAPSTLATP
jgi:predicted secreted hydrolase